MIRHFVSRPISIFMLFTAFFILGIFTYVNIPVSLLPDIPIPEITVQISSTNTSARELENTAVLPIRQRLMQVSNLRDIRSETRDGNASIFLSFEYGTNTDLAFIEVNEKIDASMSYLPKEIERPKVIKASATDIPVFNLDLTLKTDNAYQETDMNKFIELSDFAESVIRRRFEQLTEVAMVDISGLVKKQIVISPNQSFLDISGITTSEIESALNDNNVDPGSMMVRDGYYEYVIRFTSVLRTVEDIENIYIRKNDRIYQLKDLATVKLMPEQDRGMVLYNGKRAIVLSVIKQSEENMSKMQDVLNKVVEQFKSDFPSIEFNITQNQTELLDYTIANLKENLFLAFIFVLLVSVFFLNDGRVSLIIGIGLFVSLTISLLFFYLFKVSLNIISLTGLILATGMMIDSSIIVTDNISQYRKRGLQIDDACVKGTSEVVTPMLSSAFTTIAVFVPLIFLSGIAGALFFDQAFSVTVGLLVAYVTGIVFVPVLYKAIYSLTLPKLIRKRDKKVTLKKTNKSPVIERIFDKGTEWVFSHKMLICIIMLAVFPLCAYLFFTITKEKMPNIKQNELLIDIEWNENIHLQENNNRCVHFFKELEQFYVESSALIGEQQFMLNADRSTTTTEVELYVKTETHEGIYTLKEKVKEFFNKNYPNALISFAPAGTIFEKIFTVGEAELIVEYYARDRTKEIDKEVVADIENNLYKLTNKHPSIISFQNQFNLFINREKLLLYNVAYNHVYQSLRTAFKENRFATLRSQQEYLPITLGNEGKTINKILQETLIDISIDSNGRKNQLTLSTFVDIIPSEDFKTIIAGKTGEYIPFFYYEANNVENMVKQIETHVNKDNNWDVDFSGAFFSNKKMINEMIIILFISILLMYFILAAQFEDFKQPFIVLLELPIDIAAALLLLMVMGHTLNLMSAIGIVVTCGIMINDSILKVDIINQLRKEGFTLMESIHESGKRRLKAILMTSLTSIVCMAPLVLSNDMGSELEKPLAIATIGGMLIGTPISLFVVPLAYWWIYRKEEENDNINKNEDKYES